MLTAKFPKILISAAILAATAGIGLRLGREYQTIASFEVNSWTQNINVDCGVVLTGGPQRVREGIDLLHEGHIKKLIISGVNPEVKVHELLPQKMWVYYSKVSQEDIILEKHSETTWGNAQQSLPIVEALRCRDIVLITSRVHMWRAYKTFRSVFPDQLEIKTRSVVGSQYRPGLWDLLNESLKSLFYSIWAY